MRVCMYVSIGVCVCVHVCDLSRVRLCDSTDFSPPGSSVHKIFKQEYWSGLPFSSLGELPNPGIEPTCLVSPALTARVFTTEPPI